MGAFAKLRQSKWMAVAASVWIQCTSGSLYCFGIYSPLLKSSQSYNQSTLDTVAFFKDIGANIGVLSGLLYSSSADGNGPWVVLATGAIQSFVGYFLMWLSVTGLLPRPPPVIMCFYMLLAAHSQTFFNTANVVTAVKNFPGNRGIVVGIMKGFLGLSGAILIQIYRTLFNGKPSSFLLMLALLPTVLPLLLMCFVQVHHKCVEDDLRYLNEFSLIALAVAAYLMIVIIGEDFISLKASLRLIILLVLLLLVLSPLIIVLRALQCDCKSRSEYSCHARIRLIQDMSSEENWDQESSQGQIGLGTSENLNLFKAMSTSQFWLLFLVMACAMGSGLATVNNISQIGSSLGYTNMETNTLVSLWSLWNFLGRFGSGYISDYFLRVKGCARPVFISVTLALMSFGHTIISTGLPGSLHVGSMLVGLCYGSQWSLMPAITSELFGLRHFGTIFNTVAIASPVGSYLLSVRVVGFIYDKETSSGVEVCKGRHCFMLSFLIMALITLVGFAISVLLYFRSKSFYKKALVMTSVS